MVANIAHNRLVQYGKRSFCQIIHTVSIGVFFVVPHGGRLPDREVESTVGTDPWVWVDHLLLIGVMDPYAWDQQDFY